MTEAEGRALVGALTGKMEAVCREIDAELGTDAVILLLVAMAGTATRRSGRPVEHVIGVFRQMLVNEFGFDLMVVDARDPEAQPEAANANS